MIIDCHCHAGQGDLLTGPWDTSAPMEKYLLRANRAGIQKTVIFAPFTSDYVKANRNTARIAQRYPGRFFCFAFVHAQREKGQVMQNVAFAVQKLGFCGIKIHRKDSSITREVCEAAQRFNIPILYDPAGEAEIMDLLAPEYPNVNFIIPHLGSFSDDWKTHIRVIDQLVRYPNVHTDTSGIRRFDYLEQALSRAGAHKILFGTDGPWLHPGLELHKVRLLRLSKREEVLITGGNLLRLIHGIKTPTHQPAPQLMH